MPVVIETPRLRLRHLTEDDAAFLVALNANPNVYRFTGDGPLADVDAALVILRTRIFPQYERFGVGRLAVCLKDGNTPIGWCGLRFDADEARYDLGYRLLEEHWGQGFATEAASATLSWARAQLPSARITARARVENDASLRVLDKLGLVRVGEADDCDGRVIVFAAP